MLYDFTALTPSSSKDDATSTRLSLISSWVARDSEEPNLEVCALDAVISAARYDGIITTVDVWTDTVGETDVEFMLAVASTSRATG
jgi:hypothetical protein